MQKVMGLVPDEEDSRDFEARDVLTVKSKDLPKSISYRDEMTPVRDQGNLGCHDEETEVLTENGWKRFKDLPKGEKVATVNPETHKIEFQEPIRYFEYDYDGLMYHFKHRTLDCMVTPNHKMWVKKVRRPRTSEGRPFTWDENYQFVEASKLTASSSLATELGWEGESSDYFYLPSILKGLNQYKKEEVSEKKIPMEIWSRFLGMYLAEGSSINQNEKGYNSTRVGIAVSKEEERRKIRAVLEQMPFDFSETSKEFVINDKQLNHYLLQLGKAPDKFVPEHN